MSDLQQMSDLPRVEKELVESRREVADMSTKLTDLEVEKQKVEKAKDQELRDLFKLVSDLRRENDIYRKALAEIEAEKATIAYNQLGSSLKIKMLLQEPAV